LYYCFIFNLFYFYYHKIKTFTDDEEILSKLIIDKLTTTNEGKPSLCYTEIAKEAYRSGMPKLATKVNK